MKRSTLTVIGWLVGAGTLLIGARLPVAASDSYGRSNPVPSASARSWLSESGPWGTMRVSRLRLAPPDPLLAKINFKPESEWAFQGKSWVEIDAFLARAELTPDQLVPLLQEENRRQSEDGKTRLIKVSDQFRLNLSSESRRIIYDELASFEPNLTQALPFAVPTPEALVRASLRPVVVDTLRRLTFYRGTHVSRRCRFDCYADLGSDGVDAIQAGDVFLPLAGGGTHAIELGTSSRSERLLGQAGREAGLGVAPRV